MLACVKSVLESVDFLHLRNAFTCFMSTDLYCDLNNKFKEYKLLLLVQREMMVPQVFFKLVSTVSVPMCLLLVMEAMEPLIPLFITLKQRTCPISLTKILS